MLRTLLCGVVAGLLAGTAGCISPPEPEPPAAAVLEGDWETVAEGGASVIVSFDDMGVVIRIVGTTDDGTSVTYNVTGATSDLNPDDGAVILRIPTATGEVVFNGILSEDSDTLDGSLTREIAIGDAVVITIPAGNFILYRIVPDPCEDVTCEDGEICSNGVCIPYDPCAGVTCEAGEICSNGVCISDPCAGVTCEEGETCIDGECVPDDPCAGVTCEDGEICSNGICVEDDPCRGVTCDAGETCVDGECIEDTAGDPAAGGTLYAANCAACHGADGTGGFAPSVIGYTAGELAAGLESSVHDAITVTEEDLANLEAFLAG